MPKPLNSLSNSLSGTMVMIQSASSPHDRKATLEYMVMVILKQPTDGPLSKALTHMGIRTILDILALSQSA